MTHEPSEEETEMWVGEGSWGVPGQDIWQEGRRRRRQSPLTYLALWNKEVAERCHLLKQRIPLSSKHGPVCTGNLTSQCGNSSSLDVAQEMNAGRAVGSGEFSLFLLYSPLTFLSFASESAKVTHRCFRHQPRQVSNSKSTPRPFSNDANYIVQSPNNI